MNMELLNRLYEPNIRRGYVGEAGDVVFTYNKPKNAKRGQIRVGLYNHGLEVLHKTVSVRACAVLDKYNTNKIYLMFFGRKSDYLDGNNVKGTKIRTYSVQYNANHACFTITPDETLEKVLGSKFMNKPLFLHYDAENDVYYIDASEKEVA